jgi:hypothetical protein
MELGYSSPLLDNFGPAPGIDASSTAELAAFASATATTNDGHDDPGRLCNNDGYNHGLDRPLATDDPRAGLESAFRRAFAVVDESLPDRQWAREFLLDQSLQGAAQMLTNPATLLHGVWASHVDTLFEADGSHCGMFNPCNRNESMYVPAFSAGALTVGVFVSRSAPTHRTDRKEPQPGQWLRAKAPESKANICPVDSKLVSPSQNAQLGTAVSPSYSIGRYVLDAASGRIIVVSHHKSLARDAPTSTHVSYTHAQSTMRSERIQLACDGALFAAGALLDSVRYCATKNEARFCPTCGTPPGRGDCACQLPERKSAHPFDFSGDVFTMTRYLGDFLGTSNVISAASSSACTSSSSSFLKKVFVKASMLVSSTRVDGFCAEDPRHIDLTVLFQAFVVRVSTSDISPARMVMPRIGQISSAARLPNSLDSVVNQSKVMPFSAPYLEGNEGLGVQSRNEILTNDLNPWNPTPGAELSNETVDLPAGSDDSVNLNVAPAPLLATVNADLRPAIAGIWSNSGESSQDQDGDMLTDENLGREAMRRLKNREAAARSNARRRERNAALKRELSDTLRNVSELRRIETMLRSENLALRRLTGTSLLKM